MPGGGDDPVNLDAGLSRALRVGPLVDDLSGAPESPTGDRPSARAASGAAFADAGRLLNTWRLGGHAREHRARHLRHLGDAPRDWSKAASVLRVTSPLHGPGRGRARIGERRRSSAATPGLIDAMSELRRAHGGSSGASIAVISTPTTSALARDVGEHPRSAASRQPVRAANSPETTPDRARRGRGGRRRARPRSRPRPAGRCHARGLSEDALGGVEGADAEHDHARGSSALSNPASHRPHAPARHIPPRRPARRGLRRVEVAVRVEPQHPHVGRRRTTAGSVDRQIVQSPGRAGSGASPVAAATGRPPRAGARESRRSARSATRGSPGEPMNRAPRVQRASQRLGSTRPAGGAVGRAAQQRRTLRPFHFVPASRGTP